MNVRLMPMMISSWTTLLLLLLVCCDCLLFSKAFGFSTSSPVVLPRTTTTRQASSSSYDSSFPGRSATRASKSLYHPSSTTTTTALSSSTTATGDGDGDDEYLTSSGSYKVDWIALLKYPLGLVAQMCLIFGFLSGMDLIANQLFQRTAIQKIPLVLDFVFFYLLNSKTSTFSILKNKRLQQADGGGTETWEYNKRNRPSWTPPGIVFAIMWPLFVFGIRAFTAARIVEKMGGRYATVAIMSLMFHLGIGNLWNTVNNVERRLGVSVLVLYGLWLSKALTAWTFFQIDPLSGKLLALTLSWLGAAAALETRMWQINPDITSSSAGASGTKLEPLYPGRHPKWKTTFRWEE